MTTLEPEVLADVQFLSQHKHELPVRDHAFAGSLVDYYEGKGRLSPKQAEWVQTLAGRIRNPQPQAAPTQAVGEMSGMLAFLSNAKVRMPKLRLQLSDGTDVVLYVMGTKSKFPGQINIAQAMAGGHVYGRGGLVERKWYGRVSHDGAWTQSRLVATNPALQQEVGNLLREMSTAPVEAAQRFARLTGRCMFCNRGLDDSRSVAHGYGPVCGKMFNLPWDADRLPRLPKEMAKKRRLVV